MADSDTIRLDDQQAMLERNRSRLTAFIAGQGAQGDAIGKTGISLAIERFPIDRIRQRPLTYEGMRGMERILHELARTYRGGEVYVDGRLVGLGARIGFEGVSEQVDLAVSVSIGCQLRLEVGPSEHLKLLADAITVFDRHFYLACKALRCDVELLAQGCNPLATSPSDIVVTPTTRNALMSAYLSQTGRYARDAMRCTAGCELRLPLRDDEAASVEDFRLCCLLAPILAFACDNSLTTCRADPATTPTLLRPLLWSQVDPARTGIAPGAFDGSFGFATYEQGLEKLRPICFTTDEGITFSTGSGSCADLMGERKLSGAETLRLMDVPLYDVRWHGTLELRVVDSLPPRLAVAFAAMVKGLLANDETLLATRKLLAVGFSGEDAIEQAWTALRTSGWEAEVYGRHATQLIHELAAVASRGLADAEERRILDALSQLWEVCVTPRDTLVLNWKRDSGITADEKAIELYGEGAVKPFDVPDDSPAPAGETAQLPIVRS